MFRLTDDEIDAGVLFIHSHAYPIPDQPGRFTWHVTHADDWEAHGEGSSHEDCTSQAQQAAQAALEANTKNVTVAPGAVILRELVGKPPDEKVVSLKVVLPD